MPTPKVLKWLGKKAKARQKAEEEKRKKSEDYSSDYSSSYNIFFCCLLGPNSKRKEDIKTCQKRKEWWVLESGLTVFS